ncbi:MAG: hypothetical protein ACXVH3_04680 [Solirubrobacteraceae bacterium]
MSADKALPRAVRRGPPITVTCECGEKRELRYGEQWRCESCGRRYDTNRIPVEEYDWLRRQRAHERVLPIVVFGVVAVFALVLVLIGRPFGAIVLVPLAGFFWGSYVRPKRRRRQVQAIADRPRWKITAE